MSLKIEIRKLALEERTTLTQLAKYIGEKKNKDYSVQNLSIKLGKGTLNINELEAICEKLGYKIVFEKINN